MSDEHERIWLAPRCCADPDTGRCWAQDPSPWPCPDCTCNGHGVEYVRAGQGGKPVNTYDAVMRLEEDLDEAIDPLLAYWRAHEAEMPPELARMLERLAEIKADCDRAERMIRFDPFTGEGVQAVEKPDGA